MGSAPPPHAARPAALPVRADLAASAKDDIVFTSIKLRTGIIFTKFELGQPVRF